MKKVQCYLYVALFGILAASYAVPVHAAANAREREIGAYGSWRALTYDEGGQTVCYMVTTKTLRAKGPKKRGAPYLMITHRPVEASTDVFSYGAGTLLDAKHGVRLRVDNASFDLFSVRDNAWARDARTDHKLAEALRGAKSVEVLGISSEGRMQTVSDQFDVAGALQAYRAIGKACGLPDFEPQKTAVKKAAVKRPVVQKSSLAKAEAKKIEVKKAEVKKLRAKKPAVAKTYPKKTDQTHPKM